MIHTRLLLRSPPCQRRLHCFSLFFSSCLLSGLSDFSSFFSFLNTLDNSYSDSLTHVTNSETTEGRVISECFDAHGLRGNHLYNCRVTRFDEFRCIFNPETISTEKKGLDTSCRNDDQFFPRVRQICRRCGRYGNPRLERILNRFDQGG
jgi:hypothetical protein